MSINLGGQSFTEDQVIAAIAASNDPAPPAACAVMTMEEMNGVVQALLLRVATLENQAAPKHAGYSVLKTEDESNVFYRVNTHDPVGRNIVITFEIPKDAGGSAAY